MYVSVYGRHIHLAGAGLAAIDGVDRGIIGTTVQLTPYRQNEREVREVCMFVLCTRICPCPHASKYVCVYVGRV